MKPDAKSWGEGHMWPTDVSPTHIVIDGKWMDLTQELDDEVSRAYHALNRIANAWHLPAGFDKGPALREMMAALKAG